MEFSLLSSSDSIPEPVALVADAMSTYESTWALCGGWAVDSWLGRVTRKHGDVDVTVFADDQRARFNYLDGWNLVAHDEIEPGARELWNGRELTLPAHLHAREPGEENRRLVISWVTPPYTQATMAATWNHPERAQRRRLAAQRRATNHAAVAGSIHLSPWGVPTYAPELIAYYKATAYFGEKRTKDRPHDLLDFAALIALLDEGRRAWLRDSIATLHPEHPWLEKLAPSPAV